MLSTEDFALAPLWYIAFLLSLTCHEAAHALAAKWGGDLTAFHGGQVTLNPVPHMRREPWGTILVPWLSYLLGGSMLGWASAPYDPYWQQRYPRRAAWMALAGPIANFIIVLISAVALRIGLANGAFTSPELLNLSRVVDATTTGGFSEAAAVFLSIMFALNLLLGLFNLIPVAPLDGSAAIGLLLPESAALRYLELARNPFFSLVGLLLAWNLFDELFRPVFFAALRLLYA